MSWFGANAVFNPVAKALQDSGADDTTKQKVLSGLIGGLQEGGWDTEDESLEKFLDDPAIVQAFADRNVHLDDRRCCLREPGADAGALLIRHLLDADLPEATATRHVHAYARQLAGLIRTDADRRRAEGERALAIYGRELADLITPKA